MTTKKIGGTSEYVKNATDRTQEILSTSNALIFGGTLCLILFSCFNKLDPMSAEIMAVSDCGMFIFGLGFLLKKFWLSKIIGASLLSMQIVNTSMMLIIIMKNIGTPGIP